LKHDRKKKIFLLILDSPLTASGKLTITTPLEKRDIFLSINNSLKEKTFDIFPLLKYTRIQKEPLTCEASATADVISYLL
jgi:hypothetical protein